MNRTMTKLLAGACALALSGAMGSVAYAQSAGGGSAGGGSSSTGGVGAGGGTTGGAGGVGSPGVGTRNSTMQPGNPDGGYGSPGVTGTGGGMGTGTGATPSSPMSRGGNTYNGQGGQYNNGAQAPATGTNSQTE